MKPITEIAHEMVGEVVKPGDIVIDATAGNGYDTQFLANLVGPSGHVYAFDIQQQAIDSTRARLSADELARTTLLLDSHTKIEEAVPVKSHRQVTAVMFNLGYLPTGDKTLTTKKDSTLIALNAAWKLLNPGGLLSVMAYVGHPGGVEESEAVRDQLLTFNAQRFREFIHPEKPLAPRLYIVRNGS